MSQLSFEGRWNEGERASGVAVSVSFEANGLEIKDAQGRPLASWKFQDVLAAAPVRKGSGDILLRSAQTPRATLFIQGAGVARLITERAPQVSPRRQRFRVVSFSLIATLLVGAAAVVLLFGRFSASKAIAGWIPYAMADRLGRQSIDLFGPVAPECQNRPGNAALQHVLDRLQSGGDYGRPFTLHVARARFPNAFALPGRHIVLLSALVNQAKNPEEVAGIMAHEMGHGLEKDPEALFVRSVSAQALIQLMTGQSGSPGAFTVGALLLQLRYSRAAERLADAHAVEILKSARIDPKPTGDFFLRDAARAPDGDDALSYLSTHPSSRERAELFLSQQPYPSAVLLTEKEWTDAQAICGGDGAPKNEPQKAEKVKAGKA